MKKFKHSFKRFSLLFSFLSFLNLPSVFGYDFQLDGIYYNIIGEREVEVTYKSYSIFETSVYKGKITVPENITYKNETYKVTAIGDRAFYRGIFLTEVNLPSTIASIGVLAFEECLEISDITIPYGVKIIGTRTFAGCRSLKNIHVPGSVESIGRLAFSYCSALEQIDLPSSINIIADHAFIGCTSLSQVVIGESEIMPLNGTSQNNSLSVDGDLFESSTSIGEYAFAGCISLTDVKLGWRVGTIGAFSFEACSSLKEITLPWSVTSIGRYAFHDCLSLDKVTLGVGITSVGYRAFEGCYSLSTVECLNPEPPEAQDSFYDLDLAKSMLFVPGESVGIYEAVSPWNEFGKILSLDSALPGPDLKPSVVITGYDTTQLSVGETIELTAIMPLENNENPSDIPASSNLVRKPEYLPFIWSSSDDAVIEINQSGILTALSEGEAVITVTLADYPDVYDSVTFTVSSPTGISQLLPETNGSSPSSAGLSPDTNGLYRVYTLGGSLIHSTSNPADLSTLASGLYIINGHPILLK